MTKPHASIQDADAIVVGSGMGGLAAAALLARLHGKRVLVLERHWRAGGFTHTFTRPGGYRWDVGVHYVGEVGAPGMAHDAMEVATGGAVAWHRMPDPFERLVFPGLEIAFRAGRARLEEDLVCAFPDEARAIAAWFGDLRRATRHMLVMGTRALAPAPVASALELVLARSGRLARTTTGAYLARRFRDPRLRAVIAARWPDYGLPPSESVFLAHAIITSHYLEGAYYPAGTAARIAEGARSVIEDAGGAVRVRAEVERILVRDGRAKGVRLASGEELAAPVVVSDAGARATYLRLLGDDVCVPFREALRRVPPGMATVTLYLGLSCSPEVLGVRGENFWIHDDLDHEAMWRRRHGLLAGDVPLAYVSFPSLKDPDARAHTAEIVAPADMADFARWQGTAWKQRGDGYEAVKERLADALLAAVERRLPGLGSLVAYRELSTPLSTEGFTGHPGGEIYGIPLTPARLEMPFIGPRTPVRGLYLTGADTLSPGVVGAMMGGVFAVAAIAGMGTFRAIRREASVFNGAPRPNPSAPSPSSA